MIGGFFLAVFQSVAIALFIVIQFNHSSVRSDSFSSIHSFGTHPKCYSQNIIIKFIVTISGACMRIIGCDMMFVCEVSSCSRTLCFLRSIVGFNEMYMYFYVYIVVPQSDFRFVNGSHHPFGIGLFFASTSSAVQFGLFCSHCVVDVVRS